MNALRPILFLVVALSLSGCGSAQNAPVLPASRTSAFIQVSPGRMPSVSTPLLWVADIRYLTGFSLSENGNVPPVDLVEGPRAGVESTETATGPNGEVYVLETTNKGGQLVWQVSEFRADSNGDVKPFNVLDCGVIFSGESFLAVGPGGKVAVETYPGPGEIDILPSGSIGCSRGYSVISGSKTELGLAPLTIGPLGAIYTISMFGAIIVFQPGVFGNVAPHRSISGPRTKLSGPNGIAVDSNGRIYVTNFLDNSVTVYHSHANGDAPPIQRITGPNTELYYPGGIAVSSDGRIFVANYSSDSITVYAPGANGDAAPVQVIAGSATGLQITGPLTQISIAVK